MNSSPHTKGWLNILFKRQETYRKFAMKIRGAPLSLVINTTSLILRYTTLSGNK